MKSKKSLKSVQQRNNVMDPQKRKDLKREMIVQRNAKIKSR